MPTRTNGFTLIELILAIALLAVLLTLALPAMSGFTQQQRVISASNHLMTHLQLARNEAVTRNSYVTACPSPDQLSCQGNRWDLGWIIFHDPDRTSQPESPAQILRVVQPDERLLMHSGGRLFVRFQPNGGAYGSNLTVRICDPQQLAEPRSVIVSNPGRPRVSSELPADACAL